MRGNNTHLEFDLSLAKEQSDKNPMYYLQYAHARICSVLSKVDKSDQVLAENLDLGLLETDYELELIKTLMKFPVAIELAGKKYEAHCIPDYLRELAEAFHTFYHHCRIIGEEPGIFKARVQLITATKTVLKNGLSILGISAPERM
jgi:arginyl-tRNA synthetase